MWTGNMATVTECQSGGPRYAPRPSKFSASHKLLIIMLVLNRDTAATTFEKYRYRYTVARAVKGATAPRKADGPPPPPGVCGYEYDRQRGGRG